MCLGLSWLSCNLDPLCFVLALLALADLKVPIPTSCSTCELHVVKNLDLATCVGLLQDENDKLLEVLSCLSSQEPQLGMMIASCK
jgi:hypothetical protein